MPYARATNIGTLNTQGMKIAAKREEIEAWMKTNGISILAVQETHIAINSRESRKTHTWYFSGEGKIGKTDRFAAGVAFVIENK